MRQRIHAIEEWNGKTDDKGINDDEKTTYQYIVQLDKTDTGLWMIVKKSGLAIFVR